MTTTPTVIKALYLLSWLAITGAMIAFAVYDARTKRVPNRGLVSFSVLVAAALPVRYLFEQPGSLAGYAGLCLAGGLLGGGILLAAALASRGGIGGGDIKLATVLGVFYGPYEITAVLLVGTLAAFLYGLARRRKASSKELHIAYAPFLAAGAVLLFIFKLKGVLFP